MGFSVMLGDAERLVPADYWCPYGTVHFCLITGAIHICIHWCRSTYLIFSVQGNNLFNAP